MLAVAFNRVSKSSAPRIDLRELTSAEGYPIISMKAVVSKNYGRCVVIRIVVAEKPTPEGETIYEAFLPKRYAAVIGDEDILQYNINPDLKIRYLGLGPQREYLLEMSKNFV